MRIKFLLGNLRAVDHLEDKEVDESVILKGFPGKYVRSKSIILYSSRSR
jgi:hypothetical protein